MRIPDNVRKHPIRSAILLIIVCGLVYGVVFTLMEAFRLNRLSADMSALSDAYGVIEGVTAERSQGCGRHEGKYGTGITKICNDSMLVIVEHDSVSQLGSAFKELRSVLEGTGDYEVDGLRELQDEPVVAGSFGFGGYKHLASGRHCSTGYRLLEDGRGEMRMTCNGAPWYSSRLGISRPNF